jgi:hypothetical protein
MPITPDTSFILVDLRFDGLVCIRNRIMARARRGEIVSFAVTTDEDVQVNTYYSISVVVSVANIFRYRASIS